MERGHLFSVNDVFVAYNHRLHTYPLLLASLSTFLTDCAVLNPAEFVFARSEILAYEMWIFIIMSFLLNFVFDFMSTFFVFLFKKLTKNVLSKK